MGQGKNKDVAWAAGLFSGLGTFYLHQNTPALILSTADPELAEKFYAVVEVGAIRSYPRHDHAEYHWISATPDHVRYVIDLFDPYLSANLRRKAYLLYAVDISAGFKIICKNGHIRLPENLTKGNQCKPCIALRRYWKFYLNKNTDTIVEE
jgi:hypothetical protein